MRQDIFRLIQQANPERKIDNVVRRLLKAGEEYGEVCEALLNVTSPNNGKKKTWADVREELMDMLIVVCDVALTPMPDQREWNQESIEANLLHVIECKLAKWESNRANATVATDEE